MAHAPSTCYTEHGGYCPGAEVTSVGMTALEAVVQAPLYDVLDLARLLRVDTRRVRYWLTRDGTAVIHPLEDEAAANFLDLVELRYAQELLTHRLSLQRIRKIHDDLEARLGHHPFARHQLYVKGKEVFVETQDAGRAHVMQAAGGGQMAIGSVIKTVALEIVREKGLAVEWWPMTRLVKVVVNPARAFGAPTVAGHRITTEQVYEMYTAEGRRIEPVLRWFHIPRRLVEDAIKYETSLLRQQAA